MSKQYVSNSQIKIVRCVLTLYSDSSLQNEVKSKTFTEFNSLPAYIYLCGLSPFTTYYYTLEIVREFSSHYSSYEYSVTSSGKFTTGLNGEMAVEEKPDWENDNCNVYSVTVSWDFVLSQILEPDAACEMRWYYAFDDGEFIEVPQEAISRRISIISEEVEPNEGADNSDEPVYMEREEEAEHVELHFSGLSGDKRFTVQGILTNSNEPNDDYGLVLDTLTWNENLEG